MNPTFVRPPMRRIVTAAVLALPGVAAQADVYTWSTGSFVAGVTAPNPLAAGDVLEVLGSGSKSFGAGVAWASDGAVSWAPTAGVSIGSGASVTNRGLWDAQTDVALAYAGGGSTPFVNQGTLRKSAGSGTTTFSGSGLAFDQQGTLEAQTGTLRVDTPLAVFRDGGRFFGTGRIETTSSSRFEGTLFSENLHLAGGTNRVWTGAEAVVTGRLDWETGSLAGSWRVAAGQQLVMDGTGTRGVSGGTLVNDGTVAWAHTTSLALGSAALVHNRALWDAQADGSIAVNGGSQFLNEGVLRKSGGTGTTSFGGSSSFVSHGTIDVQTGTLQIASSSNVFGAGSVYQGAGTVRVTASSTFSGLQQTQNLVLAGGSNRVWTGQDAMVQGQLGWESGAFAGAWTLGSGQVLRTAGTDTQGFTGAGSVFTNLGRIEWAGTSDVRLGQGATLRNQGLIALQSNVDILNPGGGGSFVNEGRLVKQAAGEASMYSVGLSVDNRGVIEVQQGRLRLPNGYLDRGTLAGDGAFLVYNQFATEGTLAPGSDGIGMLTLDGDDGATMRAGSVLALDVESVASHDRLQVNQALHLQGATLALNCWLDCRFAVGEQIVIASFVGAVAPGGFADLTLQGFATGAFDIVYDTGAIRLVVTEAVSPVSEPGTGVLLLAGAAVVGGMARRRLA